MTIRILLAEDNPDDAALIQRQLGQSGVDVTIRRVDSAPAFLAALDEVDPDIVLTDHSMPQFTARDALRIARDARPQTPVIVVTGSLDEETAADYIKQGAADYVLKTHLVRLPAALVGALERRRALVATQAAHKALQGSEAKFARAFNANPSGMAITTLEGRVVDINEAFLRTLGYTREEAIGRTTVELGLWPSQEERAHAIQETQKLGRVQQIEIEGRTKDSARRTLLYSAELIELEGVPHVLVLTTDITERRQLEDQLRQAGKMEAVGQLAGGVAHDFNNILTAILGYADLLAEGLPAVDQRREDLEEIRKAAQRAAALTRQLLAFSRKQVLEPRSLDVNLLVDNMDKMLRPLLGENIQLRAVPAPQLHAVRADPNQIEQVILNLAVNARDAMPKGGKLTIETANVDLDEHYGRARPPRDARRQRHGNGDGCRHPGSHLRAVLHDQGPRSGHRPRSGDGIRHREAERRQHLGLQRGGTGDDLQDLLPGAQRPRRAPRPTLCAHARVGRHRDHLAGGGRRAVVACGPQGPGGPRVYRPDGGPRRRRARDLPTPCRADPPAPQRRHDPRHGRTRARGNAAGGAPRRAGSVHVRLRRPGDRAARGPRCRARIPAQALHHRGDCA